MEEKLLNYTKKISTSLSKWCKFDIWEADDISQEIFLLVKEAELIYDESKCENEYAFYFNFVKNRLINFKRDNYGTNRFKMNIADAVTLEGDIIQNIDMFMEKYKSLINSRVDASMRADYLRYCEGVKISHKRKWAVLNHIKEIIERAIKNEEISVND
jgi:hypothetical protein